MITQRTAIDMVTHALALVPRQELCTISCTCCEQLAACTALQSNTYTDTELLLLLCICLLSHYYCCTSTAEVNIKST
jgi:hypothetical protein